MNIKKNDKVYITKGKDKGKSGTVKKVLIDKNKIIITGINKYKKHIKPTRENPQGGIQDFESAISVSNVKIICPSCTKSTKTGYKTIKDKKVRICKKCNQSI